MTKQIVTTPSEQMMAELKNSYPVEEGYSRVSLPRLSMRSQDKLEGKGKNMKVTEEAGTFFIEKQTDEEDKDGKKIWSRDEIGTTINGVIIFTRKQLKYYDEATEAYTSSPIFDDANEVIPLFCNKVEVDRGTPTELRARKEYQGVTSKGKPTSKLEENKILYVLYEGEIYQLNLRGSSMYSFLNYSRSVLPPAVMTAFSSEAMEKGSINWNQMTFTKVRDLSAEEVEEVLNHQRDIKQSIADVKEFFNSREAEAPVSATQANQLGTGDFGDFDEPKQ